MSAALDEATRWVSDRGVAVRIAGSGDPVVLLHGIGGSARSCRALADTLASNGYRTFRWDAPGYGDSADPAGNDFLDHSVVVEELLGELGLGGVHLFGTSWGGVIATALALRRPELVRSIVLADSTRGSGVNEQRAHGMRARVDELATLGPEAFAAERAPRLVSPRCEAAVAQAVTADMARVRVPGYRAAAEYMAGTDHGPMLHELTVPTLVLVGEHDTVTGVDESRLLADAIPGAEFAVITGAGHAAASERPEALAAHMLRFWTGARFRKGAGV
ncbi:alpha/beta fold hydrolase [Rhodococcus triatomae]|uniref:Pimeloyl-ACP methyl ester carboxylesterase n=1 Tax=Rhodococcus triatomae TaxID=300028 RepID=A0A1G8BAT8_9NOCA|nr:alpha/beta fold hydrolase [Rhodococcus triatomae]QNG17498.1 alpha/beta fold hydrolase [Rhodococcus triatomae]QNG22834.1 alpha/beta fold hydrolase [Rhodococcus triatomae]SDH30153.1 Pimeloyl-ACP methyl ester carboxylesterase [Rhodococcus triatomae]